MDESKSKSKILVFVCLVVVGVLIFGCMKACKNKSSL
jgi:hypothetical protein